jgi:xanthine dehydrogenase molybdopterin-binding subunit B
MAVPGEDGAVLVYRPQHSSDAQHIVARVLAFPTARRAACRMGGGFGGRKRKRQWRGAAWAARTTGRTCKFRPTATPTWS